jgi:UDP-MurNAc hydroxylase
MSNNPTASPATIEFVNHASVLLSDGRTGVLSDPWYFGSTFHMGWSLLVENDDAYIRDVLARTTHIWISHEHPDHFSPPFFKRYKDQILERDITVLFQKTHDQRVAGFLRQNGFAVREMAEDEVLELAPGFSAQTVKSDLYDSALLATVGGKRVFNLNDCPLTSSDDLLAFAAKYGPCDILLTQFSYAAWKGGRDNRAWRKRAAKAKLRAMHRQMTALQPEVCIPFASFVRFSHELNSYMNDAVNLPRQVVAAHEARPTRLVFMQPQEAQALDAMQQAPASLAFWQDKFKDAASMPLARYETHPSLADLQTAFAAWQSRVFGKNSRLLMRLSRALLPFHPFAPTTVRLVDQGTLLCIDLFGGLSETQGEPDIELHSASLDFSLRNDFGLDTLFVNGCFEERRPGGFDAFAKCFAIGNLNAMGLHVGLGIFKRLDVVSMMLGKLRAVRKNMVAS